MLRERFNINGIRAIVARLIPLCRADLNTIQIILHRKDNRLVVPIQQIITQRTIRSINTANIRHRNVFIHIVTYTIDCRNRFVFSVNAAVLLWGLAILPQLERTILVIVKGVGRTSRIGMMRRCRPINGEILAVEEEISSQSTVQSFPVASIHHLGVVIIQVEFIQRQLEGTMTRGNILPRQIIAIVNR